MRLINEDAVLEIIERVTNEAVEKRQPKYLIQPRIIAEIAGLPTIEAEPVDRWISVKDKLPEPRTWVSAYIKYPSLVFGKRKTGTIKKMFYDGHYDDCGNSKVTHWMPLPESPKGGIINGI